jgi:hypothetical protein
MVDVLLREVEPGDVAVFDASRLAAALLILRLDA